MAEDIKRMNYYDGLFLKDEDFQQDQNYHARLHRLHTRYLHDVYGVVEGLKVEPIENTKKLRVRKGIAISQFTLAGEKHAGEIVLADDDDTSVDLRDTTKYSPGSDFYITITRSEEKGDMDEDKGEKPIHIIEKPTTEVKATSVSFDKKEIIVLGKVSIPATEWVSQDIIIDTSEVKTVNVADGHSLDSVDGASKDVVYVDTWGRVGIGTTAPSAELDVSGNLKARSFEGDGSKLTGISAGNAGRAAPIHKGDSIFEKVKPNEVRVSEWIRHGLADGEVGIILADESGGHVFQGDAEHFSGEEDFGTIPALATKADPEGRVFKIFLKNLGETEETFRVQWWAIQASKDLGEEVISSTEPEIEPFEEPESGVYDESTFDEATFGEPEEGEEGRYDTSQFNGSVFD
jgi:hypothetical protein